MYMYKVDRKYIFNNDTTADMKICWHQSHRNILDFHLAIVTSKRKAAQRSETGEKADSTGLTTEN